MVMAHKGPQSHSVAKVTPYKHCSYNGLEVADPTGGGGVGGSNPLVPTI